MRKVRMVLEVVGVLVIALTFFVLAQTLRHLSTYVAQEPLREVRATQVSMSRPCVDPETCWAYDDQARTMTWLGPGDAPRIAEQGDALRHIQAGYRAVFTTSVPMTVKICAGRVDGRVIGPAGATACAEEVFQIAPGTHQVTSPGDHGGFEAFH